ncbi:uncharacterized protein CLUP02_17043 [Colletotrichum lupini]|uniref:Uncharacterized protein n=1 Tax=Colletotrichum lupini TaxID=145971 RepID=A0A9Q8WQK0_9PEZI|nr:uncharacterized protein CLUP02_17043 [Colletotrichum lupini]UQC91507.1 hypothetical protein CLUP02_17043 [Colletotrichum lupini]
MGVEQKSQGEEEEDELSSSVEQRVEIPFTCILNCRALLQHILSFRFRLIHDCPVAQDARQSASDSNLKQYMSLSTRYHNVQDKFASREQRQEAFYIGHMVDSIQDLMVTAGEASTRSELVDLQRNHPKTSHNLQRSIRAIFALNFVARLNSFTDLRGRADPPNLYWSQIPESVNSDPDTFEFLGIAIVSNMVADVVGMGESSIILSGNKKLCKMYESFDPSLRFPPPEFLVLFNEAVRLSLRCNLLVVGAVGAVWSVPQRENGRIENGKEPGDGRKYARDHLPQQRRFTAAYSVSPHQSLTHLSISFSLSLSRSLSLSHSCSLHYSKARLKTTRAAPVSLIHQHHSSIHLQKESRNRTQMIEGSPS